MTLFKTKWFMQWPYISLSRDVIDATRPTDHVECFVLGRLHTRVFGVVPVPARLAVFYLTGTWLTQQHLLGAVVEEG